MENPDVPWLHDYDSRSPKPFTLKPSPAAVFFLKFLKSNGIATSGAKLADIGCGNGRDSVYFVRNGLEVHAIDLDGAAIEDLDMHGVRPHCHSVADSWLFEDGFFDFVIDVLCYAGEQDAARRRFYRSELRRTLKRGGYCLVCVPASAGKLIQEEFIGFVPVALLESEDCGNRVLGVILRA